MSATTGGFRRMVRKSQRSFGHRAALVLCGVLVCATSASSQIGSWRSHTSMREVRDLASDGVAVWAATSGGVFRHVPATGGFEAFTNIEGLSSIDITAIGVDAATGTVIAGTGAGMLNVRQGDGTWQKVYDIARLTSAQKRGITVLRVLEGSFLVGTDFGFTIYDPARREFGGTFVKFGSLPSQTGVNDVLVSGDSIWLATAAGVAVAGERRTANLQEPSSWRVYTDRDGLPPGSITAIARIGGVLVAGTSRGLYAREGDLWRHMGGVAGETAIRRMTVTADGLLAMNATVIYEYRSVTDAGREHAPYIFPPDYPASGMFSGVVFLADGTLVAGTQLGLATMRDGRWVFAHPDGPATNKVRGFAVDGAGRVWVATGGDPAGAGTYRFDGSGWTNFTRATHPDKLTSDNVYSIAAGRNGDVWLATWGGGVIRCAEGDAFTTFNGAEFGFPGTGGSPGYNAVNNVAMDAAGTMWFTHVSANNTIGLSRRGENGTPEGDWQFFAFPPGSNYIEASALAIDQYGKQWLAILRSTPALTYFSGTAWGQRLNTNDASFINVDGNPIRSLAVDSYGSLWIGTEVGLRSIYDPRITDPQKFPLVQRLCYTTICNIEGQAVNAIAIDAVNNKWLGTNNGVFVLGPDGASIIAQYNTSNSLLLDDVVRSLVVHPATGEAWIGTAKGISVLRTPYVKPDNVAGELRVSPNPFTPEIDREVQIDGLPEGASLKIFSLAGDVVANVPSPGGRIGFWNGRDAHGDCVASGVYVVAAANADGTQVNLGKIAVVRR